MAEQKPYLTGRTYIFKINKGKDLLEALTDFCHDNQIKCGIINGTGSLESAVLNYYDQAKKKFDKYVINEGVELLSLNGNVSIMDNRSNVCANIALSDKTGIVKGGRLQPGTKVFTAEVYVQELVGEPKVRKQDKVTKLSLWI